MSGWLRRAGRGRDPVGALVVWSVAEGRRGRRWREVRSVNDQVVSSLLLEVDPDGRFSHTELATSAGLLTLHVEGDGTLHGNSVTARGIEHVEGLPWDADGVLVVEGSITAIAAAAARLGRGVAEGSAAGYPAAAVDLALGVRVVRAEVTRARGSRWEVAGGVSISLDDRGLPILAAGVAWPLERDS